MLFCPLLALLSLERERETPHVYRGTGVEYFYNSKKEKRKDWGIGRPLTHFRVVLTELQAYQGYAYRGCIY